MVGQDMPHLPVAGAKVKDFRTRVIHRSIELIIDVLAQDIDNGLHTHLRLTKRDGFLIF